MINTRLARIAMLAAGLALVSSGAAAQTFPARPITLIVPFAAGGPTDIIYRMLAEPMKAELGQPIVVENRPGASGGVGTLAIKAAAPDGYTIGATGSGVTPLPFFTKAFASLDMIRDFSLVNYSFFSPLLVLVHPSLPVRDWKELIAYAKANPGKLNWGMSTVAYQPDIAALSQRTGVTLQPIVYKGSAPAMAALVAGEVQLFTTTPGVARPLLNAQTGRPIGVMSDRPWPEQPQLATMSDALGLGGTSAVPAWFGVLGPKGMPPDIVTRLSAAVRSALNQPEIRKRLEADAYYIDAGGPAALEQRIAADNRSHRAALETGVVKPE